MLMKYHNLFIQEAARLPLLTSGLEGSVAWESPSNIALIKYWGKKENQLPMNPSLSFSLSSSVTRTNISFWYRPTQQETRLRYFFHDKLAVGFENRLKKYIEGITCYLPFLQNMELEIRSENSFPHSSGIASSASAFSSIALCLLDIESQITRHTMSTEEFLRKASYLARIGSGSASRSVYEGVVLWGKTKFMKNSSDEISLPLNDMVHQRFKTFHDVILIADPQPKKIPSSVGHVMMRDNPYSTVRFGQVRHNLARMIEIMKTGEIQDFFDLVEYEALSLHAMMMTSFPGYFLMKPATLAIVEKVRQFRHESAVPVGFTLDAGANVHVLFPYDSKKVAMSFIDAELKGYCHEQGYITDRSGLGPKRIQME
jgi:diphosphomevalonate decarboxylase